VRYVPVDFLCPVRLQDLLGKAMGDADGVAAEFGGESDLLGVAQERDALARKGVKGEVNRRRAVRDLSAPSGRLIDPDDLPEETSEFRRHQALLGRGGFCLGQGEEDGLATRESLQEFARPFRNHRPTRGDRGAKRGGRRRPLLRRMAVLRKEARQLLLQGESLMRLVEAERLFRRNAIPPLEEPAELPPVQDAGVEDDPFEIDEAEPKIENPRPHAFHCIGRAGGGQLPFRRRWGKHPGHKGKGPVSPRGPFSFPYEFRVQSLGFREKLRSVSMNPAL